MEGETAVLLVSECMEGRDLNGDRDTDDLVPHVYDIPSGVTVSLGMASSPSWRLEGRYFFYLVGEWQQGATDLNGDGDLLDYVLHVYDVMTGINTNLGVAGGVIPNGDEALLVVSEEGQGGRDLDGDGRADLLVLHELDLRSGAIKNLGVGGSFFVWHGGLVSYSVPERGVIDLNQDGDATDWIAFVYDPESQVTTNLGLATMGYGELEGDHVLITVSEIQQGWSDLNGDGDALDSVLHLYDNRAGTTLNLGQDVYTGRISNGRVWMTVREGAEDLNRDGDLDDFVLEIYDIPSGSTTNVGIATGFARPHGDRGVFLVSELANGGADLNGDGDAWDWVPHTYDARTGILRDLGFAVSSNDGLYFEEDQYVTVILEEYDGGIDLNGDGDAIDGVVAIHDLSTETTRILGLATNRAVLRDGLATFLVSEEAQGGRDLNADGDVLDQIAFAFDLKRRALFRSSLSGPFGNLFLPHGSAFLVTASEAEQGGRDLNGDGDALDDVLQVIELPRP